MMRKVIEAFLCSGCTGIIRGSRSWWWELKLECGHYEERYVSSKLAKNETATEPKRVKCGTCESEIRRGLRDGS
jgi:hypothetical protein